MRKLCSWCAYRSNRHYSFPYANLEEKIKPCFTFENLIVIAMVYIEVMIYDKNINQEQLIDILFLWWFQYMYKAAHRN